MLAASLRVGVRSDEIGLLALLTVAGFGGQLAITQAFRHGQASAVAPFEYVAQACGLGLDWVIWKTNPDQLTLLGGLIIVASGLCVSRHEKATMQSHLRRNA